jgi:uncharacterized membrane protein
VEYVLFIVLAIAWAIGTPIMAIVALSRTSRLREQNDRLVDDVARLKRQMAEAAPPPRLAAEPVVEAALPPPLAPEPVVEAAPPPLVSEPVAEAVTPPPPAPPFEPEPDAAAPAAPAQPWQPVAVQPPITAQPQVGWEQRLGARAFIWIGAVTLALAAVFLVRYSIEEGYLSPQVRVILAALFGFALIGGGERIRSRDARVAEALAAAGVAALYGALFAAVALYDMISKPVAGGAALALTAFAIGVSLRHGIFVAGLAFVGGFASPAIIGSETPNTPVLFGYLLAIAAGTLAVIRLRGWWPLGWGVLVGSAIWTLLWMQSLAGGIHWVGIFLVAVAGLFVWATWRRLQESDNPTDDVSLMVWVSLGLTGVLIVGLIIQDDGRQAAGWLALAAHGLGLLVLARWTPRFQYVAALAPLLSIVALAGWWNDAGGVGTAPEEERFAWRAASFGGFYAVAAFALLWNAARPGFWAALAVAAALAHFLLSWFVLRNVAVGVPWGLLSIGLAVPFLVGAERLARWRDSMAGASEALGYFAAGVAFFIAIAIALELRREWITVAYAVEFAAVAGIAAHLGLHAMRRLCWLLLAAVIVRFVLNPEVLKYPLGVTPIFNWILWGYGLAIAALAVGLRSLRPTGDVDLVRATEAAIALLIFVLLTLEVRSLFQPDAMAAPATAFMERTFYVLVWGAFALAALWLARLRRDPVVLWAWRISGALALGLTLVMQVVIANPVLSHPVLGQYPIANGLFLAYALPAVMAALAYHWVDGVETDRRVVLLIGAAAAILAFVWISLEVRHFFDPSFAATRFSTGFMERAFYVLAWGAFALAALWLVRARRDPVVLWTWRVSGALAAVLALVVQVVIANPVFDKADVGSLPIANGLFLAYALPAAMAALARRWIDVEPDRNVIVFVEATASILVFAWVSMEVRHFFDPSFARRGLGASGLELYVYSAVWLLFGVALLALGFLRNAPAARHAGMALVCVVVAKVFLVDMAGLQGLLRVFSFLGLGAALIGLGYAYRRFGFR